VVRQAGLKGLLMEVTCSFYEAKVTPTTVWARTMCEFCWHFAS